jgi:hypothetical protein
MDANPIADVPGQLFQSVFVLCSKPYLRGFVPVGSSLLSLFIRAHS